MEKKIAPSAVIANPDSKMGQIAAWLSMACIVHCIVEPFLLPLLPLAGIVLPIGEGVESGIILVSLMLGLWNLGIGYFKHGDSGPGLLLGLAVFIFAMHQTGWIHPQSEAWHSLPIALGALILAGSQFWNRRILKMNREHNHGCCPHPH